MTGLTDVSADLYQCCGISALSSLILFGTGQGTALLIMVGYYTVWGHRRTFFVFKTV